MKEKECPTYPWQVTYFKGWMGNKYGDFFDGVINDIHDMIEILDFLIYES